MSFSLCTFLAYQLHNSGLSQLQVLPNQNLLEDRNHEFISASQPLAQTQADRADTGEATASEVIVSLPGQSKT